MAHLQQPAHLTADAGEQLGEVPVELGSRRRGPNSARVMSADRSCTAVCSSTKKSIASSRSAIATNRRRTSKSRMLTSPVRPNAANSTAATISAAFEP